MLTKYFPLVQSSAKIIVKKHHWLSFFENVKLGVGKTVDFDNGVELVWGGSVTNGVPPDGSILIRNN